MPHSDAPPQHATESALRFAMQARLNADRDTMTMWLTEAATLGDADAGALCGHVAAMEGAVDEARRHYSHAIANGSTDSWHGQALLSVMTGDHAEALAYAREGAHHGDAASAVIAAALTVHTAETAATWLARAQELGDAYPEHAMETLLVDYPIPLPEQATNSWLDDHARNNCAIALRLLGRQRLLQGDMSAEAALEYAASEGNVGASLDLAYAALANQDDRNLRLWAERAAATGHSEGQHLLAYWHLHSEHGDPAVGGLWLATASERGLPAAQLTYADYCTEAGEPQAAKQLYFEAAYSTCGSTEALQRSGDLCAAEQNFEEALTWWNRAEARQKAYPHDAHTTIFTPFAGRP